MKKLFLAASIFLAIFLMSPLEALALEPVLYFSDIESGPATGLGDGKGSGAIVTVWGANLGSSQGSSTISVGGVPAAYVYYWGNADTTGASGPADLYTYHKMQTISFSVPATAAYGANTISVTVNGTQTNTLPFTVRAGNIYHVKTTGSDSGDGSWGKPWRSLAYVGTGAGGAITPGDTIYVGDGVTAIGSTAGFAIKYIKATKANPISVIAYPGAYVLAQGGHAISNWNHDSSYWNISKLVAKTTSVGIDAFKGGRFVANEITNAPGECADGQGGAITGNNYVAPYSPDKDMVGGGIKVFGNYIHDFGCDSTSKLHHVFYISQRGGYP
ncbi:MAG: hypothetical protein ACE5GY_03250, partial [Thermodesulfobacteriota bacterium]